MHPNNKTSLQGLSFRGVINRKKGLHLSSNIYICIYICICICLSIYIYCIYIYIYTFQLDKQLLISSFADLFSSNTWLRSETCSSQVLLWVAGHSSLTSPARSPLAGICQTHWHVSVKIRSRCQTFWRSSYHTRWKDYPHPQELTLSYLMGAHEGAGQIASQRKPQLQRSLQELWYDN